MRSFETKTLWVVVLTAVTMIIEIVAGYYTHSMALLADGWHMSTHVFAIGLSWITYVLVRKYSQTGKYNFSKDKSLALAGFISAVVLQVVAVLMAYESILRLINPVEIRFRDAIIVAFTGLLVNILSAFILHHDHGKADHNIRAAYMHVIADALTSVTAIIALTAGMYFNLFWMDSVSSLIGSVIITKWSVDLIKGSGKVLIDFKKI